MADEATKRVALQPDDRERMRQLTQEIEARLKEMASIMGETLPMDFSADMQLKFERLHPGHIEIVCAPDGTCGCYVEPPGVCEFPCGSTPI